MRFGKEKKKEIIDSYFNMTIYEFERGLPLEDIELMKEEYIEKELYLQCEGIQRGIDYIKFLILTKILINENENYGNENY